jgi:hypothetical protein
MPISQGADQVIFQVSSHASPARLSLRFISLAPVAEGPFADNAFRHYLRLVDRPVKAMLSKERSEFLGAGMYLYRSREFKIFNYGFAPILRLKASVIEDGLALMSRHSSMIKINSRWSLFYGYGFEAFLKSCSTGICAEGEIWIESSSLHQPWIQKLGRHALIALKARLEKRFMGGLSKDARIWSRDVKLHSTPPNSNGIPHEIF